MKKINLLGLSFILALALAACSSPTPIPDYSTYADSAADTVTAKAPNDGLTGLAVHSDDAAHNSGLSEAELIFSDDLKTVSIYLDGTKIIDLDEFPNGSTKTALYLKIGPISKNLTGPTLGGNYYGGYYYSDSVSQNYIVVGVETRHANLPTGKASYTGDWQAAIGSSTWDSGDSYFFADFAKDEVSGIMINGSIIGTTFKSDISGNGFKGTANLTGTNYSGNTAIEGTFFGPAGDGIAGVLYGTVTPISGGANESFVGYIGGDKD